MNGQSTPNETKPTFGVLAPQDALAAIRAENRRVGLSVSEADENDMANQLASALRHDMASNRTFIIDGAGNARSKVHDGAAVDVTVADFIATIQKTVTPVSGTRPSPVPVSAGANRTTRAIAANATARSFQAIAKSSQAADLARKYGNPWAERSLNRTRQNVIQNLDPALAGHLRNSAEK